MSDDSILRLACGPLSLTLAPACGGGILRFDYMLEEGRKIPLLRGVDEVPDAPVDLASFPLVPYVNRVRGGSFSFRGRKVTLTPNLPGDPSPLHGQGWLSPWSTLRLGPADAELHFRHAAGEWPWDYEARQHFLLDEAGMAVDLSCTNLSEQPMPCGLGQHPYFPCTPKTRIDTVVESVWEIDEQVLPVAKLPATGRFDLADRLVCGQGLDHGFGGWGGRAIVADPALPFRVAMSSPDARFFQLYSPAAGGLFVAEPVTHANAALNEPEASWPELGLRVIEPGESMTLTMRVEVLFS
jgi:aldose 1-epimerase